MTQNVDGRAGVSIDVLGPLRVDGPHGTVVIRGVKERVLLAVLTAHRGQTVPVPVLIEALWADAPPPSAQKSLQTFVMRLRRALEPDRSAPTQVVTDGGGYRLAVPASAVDAERFTDLVAAARTAADAGRRQEVLTRLSLGLSLWRGPAYTEFADVGIAQAEARRLEEVRLTAVEESIALRLDLHGADAAVPELERLVRQHPYRERLWASLILGLYRQGRQGEALAAFDRARHVLGEQLGVEPGRELRELHARVLAQDPRLDPPGPAVMLPADLVAVGPLVGRRREFDRLRDLWSRARQGEAVGVTVRGAEAAGGLRLAQELAGLVVGDGEVVSAVDGPAAMDGGARGPVLVVASAAHAPCPVPGRLVLVLAGPGEDPAPGTDLLELGPLAPDEAREVIAAHVRPDDLARATAEILASTAAWPADLDRTAADWARQAVTATVRHAAAAVGRTTDELARARRELADGVLELGTAPAASAGVAAEASADCPWRGLSAYDVPDARWFAGRERLVAELLARVAGSRLVAIVGPSGSGKSSALRAGLTAALQEGALPGSSGWTYLLFRPGPHPLRELTRHTLQAGFPAAPLGDLLEQLIRGENLEHHRRVIVAVDQLEEVWTSCPDAAERFAFLDALADLTGDPLSPVTVVLTVRPDFLPQLAEHPRIAGLLADNTVLVGTPTPAEVIRAVQRPAATAGLRLQLGLTEAIADDAAGEPGLLPLLSTALTRLWAQRQDGDLTLAGYVAVGGLAGAISGMAEDAYTALDEPDRAASRVLLLRLAGPGQGADVTRRRVPMAEIEGLPNPRVRAVVEPLAAARLLTVAQDSVEVAHEALFTQWPRLRTWLAEDATTRDVQRRLAAAAADWDQQNRDPGLLWQGTRLAAGRDAAHTHPDAVTQTERDFLDAGTARVDAERRDAEHRATTAARQVRRLRWMIGGIVLLLIAASVIGVVAVTAQRRAEAAAASAEARRLAARSVTEQHLDLALLSAVEAVQAEPGPETYGALLTLLTRAPRIVTQVHAQGRFLQAAASADGSTVYLAENGPLWSAYDALTGQQKWTAELPNQVADMAADPAGRGVLTTMWLGRPQIVLLDGRDGGRVWATPAPLGNNLGYGAAWLPDGRWAVAGSTGLVIGDGDTGRIESQIPWPVGDPTIPPDFRPDYVTAWPDGRVGLADPTRTIVYDLSTGAVVPFAAPGSVRAVSTAGVLVAVDESNPERRTFRLHDLTGASLSEPIPDPAPFGIQFSPNGSELAIAAGEVLQLRDGHTGDLRVELHGHSGAVMDIVYAGAARDMTWTAGRDGTGIAWDRTGQRGILRSAPSPARTWLGATDNSGRIAVGLSAPPDLINAVSLLDPRSGAVTHPDLPLGADCRWCDPTAVAITPDGRTAFAGLLQYPEIDGQVDYSPIPNRGYVARWDTSTGSLTGSMDLPWPPMGLAVTADGTGLFVNGDQGSERLDLVTGRSQWGPVPHTPLQGGEATRTVSISPDGHRVLIGTGNGAQILDADTGAILVKTTFADPDSVSSTTFTPDGTTVILGTYGGYLHVLASTDLQPRVPRRLTTGGWLVDLTTRPDGAYLASIGSDGDLLLWDTTTWQPLGQPISDNNGWAFLGFDPDKRTLRAIHQNGTVLTFLVDPDTWIRQACAVANRDLTADESATIKPGQPVESTCAGYR